MQIKPPALQRLGGGRNFHIGLIMNAAVYANLSMTAYKRWAEPVPYAQHGVGGTATPGTDMVEIHKEDHRVYDLNENIDATLKKEVIAEVEENYLYAEKNRITWGSTESPQRDSWITSWRDMGRSEHRT